MRINILGASGCGVSSVGRRVGKELEIAYFDSDDYFHVPTDPPFQIQHSPEERSRLLSEDVAGEPSWIVGGGAALWEPTPILNYDFVVFLRVPTEIRIGRLKRRESLRFGGRIRQGGDMHETHEEFVEWASQYDSGDAEGKTLQRHERWLSDQTSPILRTSGVPSLDKVVAEVLGAIRAHHD